MCEQKPYSASSERLLSKYIGGISCMWNIVCLPNNAFRAIAGLTLRISQKLLALTEQKKVILVIPTLQILSMQKNVMVRSSAASVGWSDKTLPVPNLLDKVLPCLPACAPCLFHHIPNLERAKDKSPIAKAKARAPGQIAFYPLSFNFEFKWKSTVGNSINTKCIHTYVFVTRRYLLSQNQLFGIQSTPNAYTKSTVGIQFNQHQLLWIVTLSKSLYPKVTTPGHSICHNASFPINNVFMYSMTWHLPD